MMPSQLICRLRGFLAQFRTSPLQITRLLPRLRAFLIIAALGAFVSPGHTETSETIARVIDELGFNEGYEARVDALIEQFYSKPAVWRNDADPAKVRAKALAVQPQAEARLREVLAVKFSEAELQSVLDDVAAKGKVNFTQEGTLYALNFEFDSAISDFVMPMIGW